MSVSFAEKLNFFVAISPNQLRDRPQMTKIRYVFILGAQRSGSTLLNLILGSHSRMFAVGEAWKLNQQIQSGNGCTCGAPSVSECPFWNNVSQRLEQEVGWNPIKKPGGRKLHRTELGRIRSDVFSVLERMSLGFGHSLNSNWIGATMWHLPPTRKIAANNSQLLSACHDVAEQKIIVDSGKDPFRADFVGRLNRESSRYIFLVRDGRGVASSRLGKGRDQSKPNYPEIQSATRRWVLENRMTLSRLNGLPPEMWMRQKYEDFCQSPESSMRQICDWLDLPYEPSMLEFRHHTHHNVMGNRMRTGTRQAISMDDAWKQNLTPQEINEFELAGGWINRELGYKSG